MSEPGTTGDGEQGAPLWGMVKGSMARSAACASVQRNLEDLHVVRYDRRGYGGAVELGPPTSFDVQVEEISHVLAERPAVIVGHSLGGVVALEIGRAHV